MNTLTKSILLAAVLLAAAPTAWAQTATTKPKPADATGKTRGSATQTAPAPKLDDAKIEAQANGLTQGLKQALALSPQQEEKVRQINLRSVRQVEEARIRHRADLRKLNVIIEDIGQSRMAALKDVLTAAQFDKYQKAREKKMGIPNTQGNQGNAVPGLPPGRGEE
ncbi:hypothetical protein [Hymenobacter latericus]|uniref:hypothetical protein n=1 Tax=Hymenobacter sp. YIM 151858-1 TaxID=2987688 RepID=UPI002226CA21|nr:hypothetical protein [Hymenobacter sp. YIM 151858-1]UYZ59840.1 hypothetical protein OIS50_03365 [Hymenobacter sp. YIM 151858-1]